MRVLAVLFTMAIVSGCITNDYSRSLPVAEVPTDPESCSSRLAGIGPPQFRELNSSDIHVVNWNIQKGADPGWVSDLQNFSGKPDLFVFQEAAMESEAWKNLAAEHHRSFAPGYRTLSSTTGVMTLSSAEPLAHCSLSSIEPWLGSPKATAITQFGLTNTDQTLLVVNIHAINFTFGTSDFERQIQQALEAIEKHEGPIMLSGDFNTWHWRQSEILEQRLDTLGFVALDYDEDHRKTAFGQPLDHIYVRGLTAISATTRRVDTSDHNLMSVRLQLDIDELSLSGADGVTGGF